MSQRERQARYRKKLCAEMIAAYGGKCAVCGSTENLELDHKNGLGNHHRDSIFKYGHSSPGGWNFYLWLKKQGWPQGDYELKCKSCHDEKHPNRKGKEQHNGFVEEIDIERDILDPVPF